MQTSKKFKKDSTFLVTTMKKSQLANIIEDISLNWAEFRKYSLDNPEHKSFFNNEKIKAIFPLIEGPIKNYVSGKKYFDKNFREMLKIEHDNLNHINIGSIASEISEIYVDWLRSQCTVLLHSLEFLKGKYLSKIKEYYSTIEEKEENGHSAEELEIRKKKIEKSIKKAETPFGIVWDIPNVTEKLNDLNETVNSILKDKNLDLTLEVKLSRIANNSLECSRLIEPELKSLYEFRSRHGDIFHSQDLEKYLNKLTIEIQERPQIFYLLGLYYFHFTDYGKERLNQK